MCCSLQRSSHGMLPLPHSCNDPGSRVSRLSQLPPHIIQALGANAPVISPGRATGALDADEWRWRDRAAVDGCTTMCKGKNFDSSHCRGAPSRSSVLQER